MACDENEDETEDEKELSCKLIEDEHKIKYAQQQQQQQQVKLSRMCVAPNICAHALMLMLMPNAGLSKDDSFVGQINLNLNFASRLHIQS